MTIADLRGSIERPRLVQILVRRLREDWREEAEVATSVISSA
jgi:hypothetical protein